MRKLLIVLLLAAGAAQANGDYPNCKDKVEIATQNRLFKSMGVTARGVEVVVDVRVWAGAPYTTKIGMVSAISCVITKGAKGKEARVVIRSDMTNRILGEGPPSAFHVK